VSLAAERFGITQPAMSNALSRLRSMFGDPLFVQTSEGMQPTAFAKEIARPIESALAEARRAIEHRNVFDPATSDQTFRFHMTDMGQINFLPKLLERVRVIAPYVKIEAETLNLAAIREGLAEDRIHLAVGHLPKLTGREIRSTKLLDETYVVLVRADHPAAKTSLTQKAFLAGAHAVVTSVGGGHRFVEEMLVKKHANIVSRIPNIMAIPTVLACTDLMSTIPSRVAAELARSGAFKVFPFPLTTPKFEVSIFWHERAHSSPSNFWMRNQLIELFAKTERS
jgi:DNA-binding transcriptional LysR family regulator